MKYLWLIVMCPALCFGQATEHLIATKNYCKIGNVYNIGTGDFSALCFFKTTLASGTTIGILTKNSGADGSGRWQIYISSASAGKARALVDLNGASGGANQFILTATPVANDGLWHCVCFTLDRDGLMTLYQDGVFQTSASISTYSANTATNSIPITIGAYGEPNPNNIYFTGTVAESRIYSRVLSANEVLSIWSAFPRGSDKIISGLEGIWRGSAVHQAGEAMANGAAINDLSGYSRNGYTTNGVISAPSIIGNRRY